MTSRIKSNFRKFSKDSYNSIENENKSRSTFYRCPTLKKQKTGVKNSAKTTTYDSHKTKLQDNIPEISEDDKSYLSYDIENSNDITEKSEEESASSVRIQDVTAKMPQKKYNSQIEINDDDKGLVEKEYYESQRA